MDEETIEERLRAVERAIGEGEVPDRVADGTALAGRVEGIEADLREVEERLAEVEAAVQALRGYVGDVRSVNRDVERRADSALAKVEQLEADAANRDDSPGPDRSDGAVRSTERRTGERRGERATGRVAEHPIPELPEEERSLAERIAAWL